MPSRLAQQVDFQRILIGSVLRDRKRRARNFGQRLAESAVTGGVEQPQLRFAPGRNGIAARLNHPVRLVGRGDHGPKGDHRIGPDGFAGPAPP